MLEAFVQALHGVWAHVNEVVLDGLVVVVALAAPLYLLEGAHGVRAEGLLALRTLGLHSTHH